MVPQQYVWVSVTAAVKETLLIDLTDVPHPALFRVWSQHRGPLETADILFENQI